jgi:hypothetical protein
MSQTCTAEAPRCPYCAAMVGEVDAWRRLYTGLLRGVVEAAAAGQPISDAIPPKPKKAKKAKA